MAVELQGQGRGVTVENRPGRRCRADFPAVPAGEAAKAVGLGAGFGTDGGQCVGADRGELAFADLNGKLLSACYSKEVYAASTQLGRLSINPQYFRFQRLVDLIKLATLVNERLNDNVLVPANLCYRLASVARSPTLNSEILKECDPNPR